MRAIGIFSLLCALALVPGADESSLARAAEARPAADEECVMQCDEESDRCMAKAGDDEEKAKACDDQYAECLKKCR